MKAGPSYIKKELHNTGSKKKGHKRQRTPGIGSVVLWVINKKNRKLLELFPPLQPSPRRSY